ncbi:methyl viologen-reducing hydrogenase [Candidatus Fermentibacteria bacterium]|nr:MAG: methyl viologen-reducing hydrogenase [Candidatus Fermentibacteria bacterium]
MSKLVIDPVTRIEGHARITLDLDDSGSVNSGHLQVLEIRGFEKLLEGMELFKMPLITARICGVCPAAHHMAAVTAIENGLGIEITDTAKRLRELMYMGHILHSHALSNFVLTGPDLFQGLDAPHENRNVFQLLKMQPESVRKMLRLRSIGQRVVEIVGGRGVHPVTSVPGGMASAPSSEEMGNMASWGSEAITILEELKPTLDRALEGLSHVRESMNIPFPSVALSDGEKMAFFQAPIRIMSASGEQEASFDTMEYDKHLIEHSMDSSYMKSVRLRDGDRSFFVGPLARLNINKSFSTPKADALLADYRGSKWPRTSALDFIEARFIEMVHAAERISRIASVPAGDDIMIEAKPGPGRFVGVVEAPRGLLIHEFNADESGILTSANLIVATQNNYDAIDKSIAGIAGNYAGTGQDELLMSSVEFSLRCFDPCLACATHAAGRMPMKIQIRQDGRVLRTVSRGSC